MLVFVVTITMNVLNCLALALSLVSGVGASEVN